ncbi:Protein LIKE COV 2 [Sarracenia purpurea var. burkii]
MNSEEMGRRANKTRVKQGLGNCWVRPALFTALFKFSHRMPPSKMECYSPEVIACYVGLLGLGFVTSLVFIFFVGIFASSWVGGTVFLLGEWFIKRMPFMKHIYSASKQISAAISPDQNTTAFKEVAIIRHPRIGEYAFGFITSSVVLQRDDGDEELCSVYIPTNHLYIGDIFLVNSREIIRPNLSIREGIEIIVSVGMSMPKVISPIERIPHQNNRILLNRVI